VAVKEVVSTSRSFRNAADGLSRMPLGRSYVEDPTPLLVRPTSRRIAHTYNANDIFEPGTAILTEQGQTHLSNVVAALGQIKDDRTELVVVALCDPHDKTQSSVSAQELTRQQAERTLEFLKSQGALKIGWFTSRKATALGLGQGPPPKPEPDPTPASYVQILAFVPQ
jgi:phospholipid/cholesterol/gamma-HCH transport system substrate-binding protein